MNARRICVRKLSTALLAGALACTLFGAASSARINTVQRDWDARLAVLDPLRPYDYFELAEEVADAATTDAERGLARELFGYAGALDTDRLGRSALLALASMAPTARERDRAMAAAEIIGGRGGALQSFRPDAEQVESLSRAFSFYRRGDGRRALGQLKQDNADALLVEIGAALSGGADAFRSECKSMRTTAGQVNDAEVIRAQILVELALRQGDARSVSLDVALRGDEPLIEIDRADPASLWRIDPTRPLWRDGKWSSGQ